VSADGANWILVDVSPDILAQLHAFPEAQPARAIRDTAIVGIVLTDSQVDHTTGLLMLREGMPLKIYCTDSVHDDLSTANPLFRILGHYCGVAWRRLAIRDTASFHVEGAEGLSLRAVPLVSKAPPYSTHRHDPHEGDTLGLQVTDKATGTTLFYAPGLGRIEPHLRGIFEDADCLLVDGTFWSDAEMIELGISDKRAQDMGHLPQSGQGGMIDVLGGYPGARKVLIHINNTNPILDEDSPERAQLASAGIEIAHDGMELVV
jgi:pyrroloquinoline quinone biosynthesis protein B